MVLLLTFEILHNIFTKIFSMRILTIVFILRSLVYTRGASAGSAIFNTEPLGCWDENEIVKLRARRLFEEVLPAPVAPENITDKFIKDLVRYFRRSLRSVEAGSDHHTELLKDAMADTLGAHLRNEILPAARLAFYSGNISHKNALLIHEFFEEMKEFLNTQGLGWQEPQRIQRWSNITVAKIAIPKTTSVIMDPCSNLVLKRDLNSCIHFPIPKLDDKDNPRSVALPFKNGGLVSLTAPSSKNILLKYYTTAAKCVLKSSPPACRKADIACLNRDLWNWLKREVAVHIQDEKLYIAFGGVLKVAAAVQAHRNARTRRNVYEDIVESDAIKWHPFDLSQSLQKDFDWSPIVYILVVVAIAVAFFFCQIVMHLLCTSNSNKVNPILSYTNMNMRGGSIVSFLYERLSTTLRTVMPPKTLSNNVNLSDKFRDKPKTMSPGSTRTQKVYDLNENTEKLMAIVSGNEMSESTSDSDADARMRSNSPPKLDASISEVKIDQQRKSAIAAVCSSQEHTGDTYNMNLSPAMCSTSRDYTEELSERNPSDSLWTVSESASSRSESSTTSKYCSETRKQAPLDQTSDLITSVKYYSNTQINLNSFKARLDDTK